MTIGQRIKAERERQGLTIKELAKKAGVRKEYTIEEYENNIKMPKVSVLSRIADALYEPIEFFFNDEEPKPQPMLYTVWKDGKRVHI